MVALSGTADQFVAERSSHVLIYCSRGTLRDLFFDDRIAEHMGDLGVGQESGYLRAARIR
jgi:hypothetical protein